MAITRYESYSRREIERPVQLEKTEGVVVIEGRAYPAKEVVAALAQSGYAEIRTEGDALILGRKRITPIFKSRQERVLASLCHGSLAYCCPLSKRCPERDRALEVLGLTPEDYERMKKQEHHDFLELSKGLQRSEGIWGHQGTPYRAVNNPAVDAGFGAEDYRADFDHLEQSFRRSGKRKLAMETEWEKRRPQRGAAHENKFSPSILDTSKTMSNSDRLGVGSSAHSTCSLTGETIDGLGALFRQGELSPFSDDAKTKETGQRKGFCFSCGRTISLDARRCPYCGAIQ